MRACRNVGQRDRLFDRRLGAPGAAVQPPFVVRVTGAVRPALSWNAAAFAIDADREMARGDARPRSAFSGNRDADWDHPAFVLAVWAGADCRRVGQKAEPVAHNLSAGPIGKMGF